MNSVLNGKSVEIPEQGPQVLGINVARGIVVLFLDTSQTIHSLRPREGNRIAIIVHDAHNPEKVGVLGVAQVAEFEVLRGEVVLTNG
jgi:chemotaxis signal transduction protein